MTRQRIINNPEEWIITRHGDFVRIKDSEISVEKKLETIRERLKKPFRGKVRFTGKTLEQIAKERYDKVWEEVNFDAEKLHDWLYDEKNKDKIEIVKLEGHDKYEAYKVISTYIKNSYKETIKPNGSKDIAAKWRFRKIGDQKWDMLTMINEETGQIVYGGASYYLDYEELKKNLIPYHYETKPKEKHTSTLIFLHGTYGAINNFREIEKYFPNTKFIYPHSPTLQYDMWHGSEPALGGQCKGWINITGDAHEIMDTDVCPNNPPPKKNFEEADKIIHLDYPQLRRAVNHVNDIIAEEIASGILPEKIFISGYSQGGLLTLATALTPPHKIGGFISLCGLLPRWDKLLVKLSDKNKATPILLINNSKDPWVPFWTGQKSYDLLKERGYNVEFKTRPGRGHGWENEDVEKFLVKCLFSEYFRQKNILSIEIKSKGLLIKYQNGEKATIPANEFTPEQQEIKNYLETNNKKSLTWEELEVSQVHNPDNPRHGKEPQTSHLWVIIIIVTLGLMLILIVIIWSIKKSAKTQKF